MDYLKSAKEKSTAAIAQIREQAKKVTVQRSQSAMQHSLNALRRLRLSTRYEILVLVMFFGQFVFFYDTLSSSFAPLEGLGALGFGLFLWCAIQHYESGDQSEKLITTGPYHYTRHPMALGLLVCNLSYWCLCSVWTSPLFLIMELAFLVGLVGAIYYDEAETLERFGKDAVEYYGRTPRVPRPPTEWIRRVTNHRKS